MSRNTKRVATVSAVPPPAAEAPAENNNVTELANRTANTEFVELPSRGMFYPANHPLRGQEVVEIRYMTARDEDILTSPTLLQKGLAVDKFIQNILVDQSIRVDSLLVGDKSAIMVAARITGYGPDYEVNIKCPECGSESEFAFDLSDYEKYFNKFEQVEEFQDLNNGTFSIVLPQSGNEVVVRLLTSADEKSILNRQKSKKKNKLADSQTTDLLKMFIVSIDGVSDPVNLDDMIMNMSARDSRLLRREYTKLVPTVKIVETFDCMFCGTETEMEVPLEARFFWPDF